MGNLLTCGAVVKYFGNVLTDFESMMTLRETLE